MQFETRLLAAAEEECVAVGESAQPLNEWSGVELPEFDTVRLATLHAVLTGDGLQVALDHYEPVFVSVDDTVVLQLSGELTEALLALDEEAMALVAGELAATEEFESVACTEEDALVLLEAMSDLAQLAESQEQVLFLVMRPLEIPED